MFSVGIERDHWQEMGKYIHVNHGNRTLQVVTRGIL